MNLEAKALVKAAVVTVAQLQRPEQFVPMRGKPSDCQYFSLGPLVKKYQKIKLNCLFTWENNTNHPNQLFLLSCFHALQNLSGYRDIKGSNVTKSVQHSSAQPVRVLTEHVYDIRNCYECACEVCGYMYVIDGPVEVRKLVEASSLSTRWF